MNLTVFPPQAFPPLASSPLASPPLADTPLADPPPPPLRLSPAKLTETAALPEQLICSGISAKEQKKILTGTVIFESNR